LAVVEPNAAGFQRHVERASVEVGAGAENVLGVVENSVGSEFVGNVGEIGQAGTVSGIARPGDERRELGVGKQIQLRVEQTALGIVRVLAVGGAGRELRIGERGKIVEVVHL